MKAARPKATICFRSLGCPKNQVDSEVMLARLALAGYAVAEKLEDADVAIVNTCSFIESAREESVQAILELAGPREEGRLRALVVTGCLPQRYGEELARELPEVDAFVGTGRFPEIAGVVDRVLAGGAARVQVEAGRTYLHRASDPRLLIGGRHTAYLKIAEGCDRACAFCAIPGIRGRFQSRTLESILQEARALGREGVRELNLVSQDTTSYGKDLHGRPRLAALVRALDGVESLEWIRLLYLYPTAVDDPLLDALAGARRVLPYLDIPLQHASDSILRRMQRGVTGARQRRLVERLRERVPGVVLRTTFLVGFPGETDRDFEQLLDLVREARFDRLGVFRYSDEEGTAARDLGAKVPPELAREREAQLLELQQGIMREKLGEWIGKEERVLVDRGESGVSIARLWCQAPEIDGVVRVTGAAPAGRFARVRITGLDGVDLRGELRAAGKGG